MIFCLAVAAEGKLDNQATEIHAAREGEDRTECTQRSGNLDKSPLPLCLFKHRITKTRMNSIS